MRLLHPAVTLCPDLRRHALTILSPGRHGKLTATIHETECRAEGSGPKLTLPLDADVPKWTPERPALITLSVSQDGGVHQFRTGLRDLGIQNQRFQLNGQPFQLRAVHAGSGEFAHHFVGDSAAQRLVLERLRAVSLNAIVIAQQDVSGPFLDACDETGMMLLIRLSSGEDARLDQWQHRPALVALMAPSAEAAQVLRSEDPSRLILFTQPEDAPVFATHYLLPHKTAAQEIAAPMLYLSPAISDDMAEDIRRIEHGHLPFVWVSPGIDPAASAGQGPAWARLSRILNTNLRAAGWACGTISNALGAPPARHGPLALSLDTPSAALAPNAEASLRVLLRNNAKQTGRADLGIQLAGPTGQLLWKKKRNVKLEAGEAELWSGHATASPLPGTNTLTARLMMEGRIAAQAEAQRDVLEPPARTAHRAHVLGSAQGFERLFRICAHYGSEQAPIHCLPRLSNTMRAYPVEAATHLLGAAANGACAIIFDPPGDWNAFCTSAGVEHLRLECLPAVSEAGAPLLEAAPLELFQGLPVDGGLGPCFGPVWPHRLIASEHKEHAPRALSMRPFERGAVIFCMFRLQDAPGDLCARRLFVNLLELAASRALNPGKDVAVYPGGARYIEDGAKDLIGWRVSGPWHAPSVHLDKRFPLETEKLGLTAATEESGWFQYFAEPESAYAFDMLGAVHSPWAMRGTPRPAVYYAYTEFGSEHAVAVDMELESAHPCRAVLNDAAVFEGVPQRTQDGGVMRTEVRLRHGRNRMLVKIAAGPGPVPFACRFFAKGLAEPNLKWPHP